MCLSPPSAPESWSGQNDVHFFPSILLHYRHPCTKSILITCCIQILVTCCIRILVTCCIQILVTCCIRILVTCCIRILVTCCIQILVTCLFESSSHNIFESIINHIHKKSVMTGNSHKLLPSISAASHRPEYQIQQSKSSKDI